jgi:hypothetical protein
MQAEKNYIPINCWKCKAQNNAAMNSVCRICGCFLKKDAESGIRGRYTSSFTDHPAYRSLLWLTLGFVMIVGSMIYFYGPGSVRRHEVYSSEIEAVATAEPPAENISAK